MPASDTHEEPGVPKAVRLNPFAAYGKASQFSQFTHIKAVDEDERQWSDDALPLNGVAARRTDEHETPGNAITVKTSVEVSTALAKGEWK